MEAGYWITGTITTLLGILTVIEKSQKIKWKPISWFLGKKETDEKIDKLATLIGNLSKKMDDSCDIQTERYKEQAKMFVSNFAADIRCCKGDLEKVSGVKTKGQFVAISNLCKEYLDRGWNSEVKHDAEYIMEIWKKLEDKI